MQPDRALVTHPVLAALRAQDVRGVPLANRTFKTEVAHQEKRVFALLVAIQDFLGPVEPQYNFDGNCAGFVGYDRSCMDFFLLV